MSQQHPACRLLWRGPLRGWRLWRPLRPFTVEGLQGAHLLISLLTVLEKHQLGGFVSQVVTKNTLGGHWVSLETLRCSSTGKLVELWLGLNQQSLEFMLVEVFKRELMLKILIHTREYKPFDDHIHDVHYLPSSCLRAYLAPSVLQK